MLGIGIAASRVSGGFSPTGLFTDGVVGAWYDPTDIGTLFTDSAGTIPVTADGDPVGKMLDKSGNGRHMIASGDARPLYKIDPTGKPYLYANDPESWMSCAGFNMSTVDTLSLFAGIQRDSIAAFAIVCELSTSVGSNNGSFYLAAPVSASNTIAIASKGTSAATASKTTTGSPLAATITALADISSDSAEIRVNDLSAVTSATDQGSGNYGNHTLYLFRRAGTSSQFSGRLYQLIIRGAASTEAEIAATKAYIQSKVV